MKIKNDLKKDFFCWFLSQLAQKAKAKAKAIALQLTPALTSHHDQINTRIRAGREEETMKIDG